MMGSAVADSRFSASVYFISDGELMHPKETVLQAYPEPDAS